MDGMGLGWELNVQPHCNPHTSASQPLAYTQQVGLGGVGEGSGWGRAYVVPAVPLICQIPKPGICTKMQKIYTWIIKYECTHALTHILYMWWCCIYSPLIPGTLKSDFHPNAGLLPSS